MVLTFVAGHCAGAGRRWPREALIAAAIALAAGLMAVCAALIVARLRLCWLNRRLGGYTGDGLGAAEQCGGIVVFFILAGVAS